MTNYERGRTIINVGLVLALTLQILAMVLVGTSAAFFVGMVYMGWVVGWVMGGDQVREMYDPDLDDEEEDDDDAE